MRSTKSTGTILKLKFLSHPVKWAFLVFLAFFFLVLYISWIRVKQGPLENTSCIRITGHYMQLLQQGTESIVVSPELMDKVRRVPYRKEPNNELYGDEGLLVLQERFDREATRLLPQFYQACIETQEQIVKDCGFKARATAAFYSELLWSYRQQSASKDLEGLKSAELLQFGRTQKIDFCRAF